VPEPFNWTTPAEQILELPDGKVQLFCGDHDGRGKTDGRPVRVIPSASAPDVRLMRYVLAVPLLMSEILS
jgi:hypothetical protein